MARIKSQQTVPVWLIAVAVALIAARVASLWFGHDPATVKTAVRWVSPDVALARAQQTGKPILYDFTAAWCEPCHQLDEAVFADARLANEINEQFIAVRIVDRQREEGRNSPQVAGLQRRFAVSGFPTVVIADASGSVKDQMVGFESAAAFERMMERVR